jgi:hypothetical protein
MISRLTMILTGALAIWAGTAAAAPTTEGTAPASRSRTEVIAARMAKGESYDQAARNAIQDTSTEATSPGTSRVSTYAALMAKGASYDQATSAARKAAPEATEAINTRWNKHLAAMQVGAAHEAGWAASASN